MASAVIVGGGPAGSMAARLLAGRFDVTVLDSRETSGKPVQCTGLITEDTVRMSGIRPDILNTIYGAKVHFPGGGIISVRSEKPKGVLVDRYDFDTRMADAARDAGAEYRYSDRYTGAELLPDKVSVHSSGGRTDADLLIGADGHTSSVLRSMGFAAPRFVRGMQVDIKHRMEDQETMELRVGSLAPGFFSWEIPLGDLTRVGLCARWSAGPPSDHLSRLLRKTGLDMKEVVSKISGKIPVGGVEQTFGDRTMLIGDAAGQVKPVSGGGLYPMFKAAPHLASVAFDAADEEDFSSGMLSAYERRWKKEIGRELKMGCAMVRMYRRLSDEDLDRACRAAGTPKMLSILNDIDLDAPSTVVRRMLRHPMLALRFLPTALRAVI